MATIKVKVEDAVGKVLCHDLTKIVPGEYKGPAFKKGHIIREKDIEHLKNIGKEHINLLELAPNQLHEHDAVTRIAKALVGNGAYILEPSEGRVNIKAKCDGILKINKQAVYEINSIEHAVVSTIHANHLVKKDTTIAAVKVVPLVVEETMIEKIEEIAQNYESIIYIKPIKRMKVGIVITGSEVYHGRITDKFAPVFTAKMEKYNCEIERIIFKPDDSVEIKTAIMELVNQGVDIIIASGGMSVDADDVTPEAIRATGASVVTYGTPVLPGGMFMLAYLGEIPILGVPACGMYAKITVFDFVIERVIAGELLTKGDIAEMGYGGLCLGCKPCTYPKCPFGKY